jgi:hypothetical protein
MNRLAVSASIAALAMAVVPMAAMAQSPAPVAPPAPPAAPAAPEAPDTEAMEAAIEAAAAAFEVRMEAFGRRAEAIDEAEGLSDEQREARMAALWNEYQPEVAVFSAAIAEQAGAIAQLALASVAEMDLGTLITDALTHSEVQEALRAVPAMANGVASNGAWAQNDPEQLVTYGLMAQYGMDLAMDEAEDAAEAMAIEAPASPSTR